MLHPITGYSQQILNPESVTDLFRTHAVIESFTLTLMNTDGPDSSFDIFYSKSGPKNLWPIRTAWEHYTNTKWEQEAWVVAKNVRWAGGHLYREMSADDTNRLLAVQSKWN